MARKHSGSKAGLFAALALTATLAVTVAAPAVAKKMNGGKRSETISGTKGADKIKGKGGNDRLKGKGGNDAVNGGKGRDKVVGGPGADRHLGGPGNDVVKAADKRVDRAINGGAGKDRCVIDTTTELLLARNCETVVSSPGGAAGPGPGAGEGLRIVMLTGLVGCEQELPLCAFTISGDGADAPAGTVTGGGGVTAAGASVVVTGPEWTAAGFYGCTADGYLRVTIGSETIDAPVDCAS